MCIYNFTILNINHVIILNPMEIQKVAAALGTLLAGTLGELATGDLVEDVKGVFLLVETIRDGDSPDPSEFKGRSALFMNALSRCHMFCSATQQVAKVGKTIALREEDLWSRSA